MRIGTKGKELHHSLSQLHFLKSIVRMKFQLIGPRVVVEMNQTSTP